MSADAAVLSCQTILGQLPEYFWTLICAALSLQVADITSRVVLLLSSEAGWGADRASDGHHEHSRYEAMPELDAVFSQI